MRYFQEEHIFFFSSSLNLFAFIFRLPKNSHNFNISLIVKQIISVKLFYLSNLIICRLNFLLVTSL